ncbi:hypothetical protein ALC62_08223 [Cyphomyrmex costatus]|uniref:Uncharacterized protein n=1 Tax=Cyphomyrmex costatus TaxID=456900 RepID=A0A195CKL5_9HYME|nr:hypothetical protein ALC62_08223 [Cyphomyrmex costatus]
MREVSSERYKNFYPGSTSGIYQHRRGAADFLSERIVRAQVKQWSTKCREVSKLLREIAEKRQEAAGGDEDEEWGSCMLLRSRSLTIMLKKGVLVG